MEDNCSFSKQISDIILNCRRKVAWILRVFKTREQVPMMTLYKALVLPLAEYCCQLWNPAQVGDIRKIEAIQRSFTYKIRGLGDLNYWERLKKLSLLSLERRRERYMIIYTWKIIRGIVPNFTEHKIEYKDHIRLGRRCKVLGFNTQSLASVRTKYENSFAVMGPRLFNSIPPHLRGFEGSLSAFKVGLGEFLSTVADKPLINGYYQQAESNSIIAQLAQTRANT